MVIEAASPMNEAILRPIYQRLACDPGVELCFTTPSGVWRPEQIFGSAGPPGTLVPASSSAWMKADAYVNADFWDMTWLHRRTRRIHLFHGVAGKYGLDAPTQIAPIVANFDCLMFVNADRRSRYVEAGLTPDDEVRAALVGYPKVDCLVDGSLDRVTILRGLGLDPDVPTILYAPTWSPYSSLNTMGEAIIDAIAAEGLQVIVKLHDRSYDRAERGSGGIDWAARLSRFESQPRIRIARAADACPFLAAADAMVSDHSSIAFEYMLLDRPIVVIDCPELLVRAAVSEDKVRRLRCAADVVQDADEMIGALVQALKDPDRLTAERRRIARELFHEPGTATSRALQLIYRLIDLPAPVDRPVEQGCAVGAAG